MTNEQRVAKVQAQQIADGLNEWIGLEVEMTRPTVESLIWAFAQDQNLKHAFDALVSAERARIEAEHNEIQRERDLDNNA